MLFRSLGDNVIIKNSIIGPYVSIGNGTIIDKCKIENSIIMEGTMLENIEFTITDSLIGRNVTICGTHNNAGKSSFTIGDKAIINL